MAALDCVIALLFCVAPFGVAVLSPGLAARVLGPGSDSARRCSGFGLRLVSVPASFSRRLCNSRGPRTHAWPAACALPLVLVLAFLPRCLDGQCSVEIRRGLVGCDEGGDASVWESKSVDLGRLDCSRTA